MSFFDCTDPSSGAAAKNFGGTYDSNARYRKGALRSGIPRPVEDVVNGKKHYGTWLRPAIPTNIFAQRDPIEIQTLEFDSVPGYDNGKRRTEVRVFALLRDGRSVCMRITNFKQRCYVRPSGGATSLDVKNLVHDIDKDAIFEMVCLPSLVGFTPADAEVPPASAIMVDDHSSIGKIRTAVHEYKGRGTLEVFEANVPAELRFMIDREICGGSWVKLDPTMCKPVPPGQRRTTCHFEAEAGAEAFEAVPTEEDNSLAPIRTLSFDIECCSADASFPRMDRDPVIQISNVLIQAGAKEPLLNVVFVLDECDPLDDCEIICFSSERELLAGWQRFVQAVDPDILTGYNTDGFDIPYICQRAKHIGLPDLEMSLGRDVLTGPHPKWLREGQDWKPRMPGRVSMDVLQVLKAPGKANLRSYTLNSAAKHYLGADAKKDDVHHSMIRVLHHGSTNADGEFVPATPTDRAKLAHYCAVDAMLPIRIIQRRALLEEFVELARVAGVPFGYVYGRGQSIRVFSCLLRYTLGNMIIPTPPRGEKGEKFDGATVIEPKAGYYELPITTLDFASLYPSIMQAHNICYSTLLQASQMANLKKDIDYRVSPIGVAFALPHIKEGLLRRIETNLLAARRKLKKLMAEAHKKGDTEAEKMYNAAQLAVKVLCNAVYGFTGAVTGFLPCLDISRSITAYGRAMIDHTKAVVEEHYTRKNGYAHDAEVVYGDSVASYTPLVLRHDGCIFIWTALEFWGKLTGEKDTLPGQRAYVDAPGWETWSDSGWVPVRRIMRHTNDRPLVRVRTKYGLVDVTEDHSLLKADGTVTSPAELVKGEHLLHAWPAQDLPEAPADKRWYVMGRLFGIFTARGSLDNGWEIRTKRVDFATEIFNLAQLVHPNHVFALGPVGETKFYAIKAIGSVAAELVEYYKQLFGHEDGRLRVPFSVMNGHPWLRTGFVDGFMNASSANRHRSSAHCVTQVVAQGLWYVATSVGFGCSVYDHSSQPNTFQVSVTRCPHHTTGLAVTKIRRIDNAGPWGVFDLTTESGHFSAGLGALVVHNTDSVMIKFGVETVEESIRLGEEAAQLVTNTFHRPIDLEFEKVYLPYLLLKKKKYAGLLYTRPDKPDYIDNKGIETKRRDNAKIVKRVLDGVLDRLLRHRDKEGAAKLIREAVREIEEHRVDYGDLIISKTLRKPAEQYEPAHRGAHAWLALKIAKRDPSLAPPVNSRIPYIIVEGNLKTTKKTQLGEDPVYAIENGLLPNVKFYVEDQLFKTARRIIEPVFGTERTLDLFATSRSNKRLKRVPSRKSGLLRFVEVMAQCLGCGTRVPADSGGKDGLCEFCENSRPEVEARLGADATLARQLADASWQVCRDCQGERFFGIKCGDHDCENHYKRIVLGKRADELESRLASLNIEEVAD